jgi:uncharacterized Zn-binding protein involved in type VI secretion
MPGKPAARLTDMTAHGGTITGPGVPTVLIGKMPAATLGDMHVCPMMTPGTPPIPHVGGPITLGSTGVFIGKKPAARMGDMAVCVGPPSTVVLGCMTVMIGEAGSGSQAGPAASASAAKSAAMKGSKSVAAMAPPPYQTTQTQNHFVDVLVQDKRKKPLSGMVYKLKDPLGVLIPGATTPSGKIRHEGYAAAGSYEVQILSLANAKWGASKVDLGKPVDLSVDCDGIEDGTDLVFHLTAEINAKEKVWFASLTSIVQGNKSKTTWTLNESQLEALLEGRVGELTGVTFLAVCENAATASAKLEVVIGCAWVLVDREGNPLPDTEVEVETSPGKLEKMKTDSNGKLAFGTPKAGVYHLDTLEDADDDS